VVPDGPLLRLVQPHLLLCTSDMYVSLSRHQEKEKKKREMKTKDDKKY
jgi:hypothetical protein